MQRVISLTLAVLLTALAPGSDTVPPVPAPCPRSTIGHGYWDALPGELARLRHVLSPSAIPAADLRATLRQLDAALERVHGNIEDVLAAVREGRPTVALARARQSHNMRNGIDGARRAAGELLLNLPESGSITLDREWHPRLQRLERSLQSAIATASRSADSAARAPVAVTLLADHIQHLGFALRSPIRFSQTASEPMVGDVLNVDEVLFIEIFDNLLSNAVHAVANAARKNITVQLRFAEAAPTDRLPADTYRPIAAPARRSYVAFEVTDTGEGMTAELRERVWQGLVTTRPGGTGLGLGFCLEAVQRHGGFMEVTSRPGGPTTMRVYLPPHQVARPLTPVDVPEAAQDTIPDVLVIDDNEDAAESLALLLRLSLAGKTVTPSPLVARILPLLQRGRRQLVLLDYNIPREPRPADNIRLILEANPDARLVILSGEAFPDELRVRHPTVHRWVTKPVDLETHLPGLQAELTGN